MISEAHNQECMEAMAEMPDNAFDLCFTDPPYNVGMKYSSYDDNRSDYREWCNEWFTEASRVSRVVVFTPGIVNLVDWVSCHKPLAVMSWFKPNQCSSSTLRGFNVWEPLLVYGKPKYQIPQDGILEPIALQPSASFHACPKHLKTWQKLIGWFARPGDSVLDIFLGSGTSRIACYNLGIDFTGYELDKDYFKAQEQRFANHISQGRLFEPEPEPPKQDDLFTEGNEWPS